MVNARVTPANGATFAGGTMGTIKEVNKTGNATNVVGAGGLLHTVMDNYKFKWQVDLNDWLKFTHTIGYWQNNAQSSVQSYLWQNGVQTFGGINSFANGAYNLVEQHLANAVSLKSDTRGTFDFEVTGSWYTYLTSRQRGPSGVGSGLQFSTAGTIARMDGTGWWTADAKGIWRPEGLNGPHEVSFGVHGDQYILNGSKTFITNGINSDLVIVACKTDPAQRHTGMSLLVVERGMPGFERGRNLDKIGMHSQDTAELFFNDVRVPVANSSTAARPAAMPTNLKAVGSAHPGVQPTHRSFHSTGFAESTSTSTVGS